MIEFNIIKRQRLTMTTTKPTHLLSEKTTIFFLELKAKLARFLKKKKKKKEQEEGNS